MTFIPGSCALSTVLSLFYSTPNGSRIDWDILQNFRLLELVPRTNNSLELGEKQTARMG